MSRSVYPVGAPLAVARRSCHPEWSGAESKDLQDSSSLTLLRMTMGMWSKLDHKFHIDFSLGFAYNSLAERREHKVIRHKPTKTNPQGEATSLGVLPFIQAGRCPAGLAAYSPSNHLQM